MAYDRVTMLFNWLQKHLFHFACSVMSVAFTGIDMWSRREASHVKTSSSTSTVSSILGFWIDLGRYIQWKDGRITAPTEAIEICNVANEPKVIIKCKTELIDPLEHISNYRCGFEIENGLKFVDAGTRDTSLNIMAWRLWLPHASQYMNAKFELKGLRLPRRDSSSFRQVWERDWNQNKGL